MNRKQINLLLGLCVWGTLVMGCREPQPEPEAAVQHRIVFQSERENGIDVFMMNADGSNPVNVSKNGAQGYKDRHPSGSWDGARIAFRSDRDGNPDVFVMNADGSNQTNLTRHEAADIDPSFSPDGSQITFDSDRDGNVEVYEIGRASCRERV